MDQFEDDTEIVISFKDYKVSQQKCRDLEAEIKLIRSMNQEYIFKINNLQEADYAQQKQIKQQLTELESIRRQNIILTDNEVQMKSINIKLVQKQKELGQSLSNINEDNLNNQNAIIEQHKLEVKDLQDKITFINKAFCDQIASLSLENSKLKVNDKQNELINSSNIIQTMTTEITTLKEQSQLESQQLQIHIQKLMNDIYILESENNNLKETISSNNFELDLLQYENQQYNIRLDMTNQLFNQQTEQYLQMRNKLEEQIAELDSYRSITQNSKDNDLSNQKIVPMRIQSQLLYKQTNALHDIENTINSILKDAERMDRLARRSLCGQLNQTFHNLYKNALKQEIIIKFEIVDNRTL